LRQQGNGRVVVDVGLAFDALETEAAVANGFNVIGFEPDPPNVAALRKKFARDSRIHVVDLVSGAAAAAPASSSAPTTTSMFGSAGQSAGPRRRRHAAARRRAVRAEVLGFLVLTS
jgi:hypothetical protein